MSESPTIRLKHVEIRTVQPCPPETDANQSDKKPESTDEYKPPAENLASIEKRKKEEAKHIATLHVGDKGATRGLNPDGKTIDAARKGLANPVVTITVDLKKKTEEPIAKTTPSDTVVEQNHKYKTPAKELEYYIPTRSFRYESPFSGNAFYDQGYNPFFFKNCDAIQPCHREKAVGQRGDPAISTSMATQSLKSEARKNIEYTILVFKITNINAHGATITIIDKKTGKIALGKDGKELKFVIPETKDKKHAIKCELPREEYDIRIEAAKTDSYKKLLSTNPKKAEKHTDKFDNIEVNISSLATFF